MYQAFGVFATLYGTAMAAAPFLQAVRILRRRSSSDVSVEANLFAVSGCVVWIIWGVASHNPPILIANVVGLCSFGMVSMLAMVFHRR